MAGIGAVAARTGIHGGYQHEIRRISDGIGRPRNGHRALFQWLAQDFKGLPLKFRQFVKWWQQR
jgi:hypothetical protein